MEYQIAILGSANAVLGFKALGVEIFPVVEIADAHQALEKIKNGSYGVLFITEDWATQLKDEIDELARQTMPAITFIPSQHGTTNYGYQNLKKIVEQAVGSDILSKSEN
ncbi:MAG: V-type ATP synthase subunit F [Patescibacteria group bacterium]|jgi:V/A-type H+-transporting ATPase subunit F|nr:V-type ATP synthase subunit F [Patescibacteria group bacterium]